MTGDQSRLIRVVGRWDLLALAINGVIGTSIFGLSAETARLAGPWGALACFACAGIVLVIVLCFAEAASLFTGTGGPYLYTREAFGDPAGLAAGWLMWLARVTAFAANANLFVSYFGYFAPGAREAGPRAAILIVASALLTWVNVRGVRESAHVGDVLAAAKLLPMTAFVVVGLFFIDPRLMEAPRPGYTEFGEVILLHIFAFTGFEFAAIPAGEALSPKKHVPFAMVSAVALAALLYTGIHVVCVGTLPGVAQSKTAMADAATRFMGSLGGGVIALAALSSISSNLSGMYLVAPRLTYALASDGLLPSWLASVHPKYRTPYVSIFVYGAPALILALTGTFVGMVKVSVVIRIAAYVLTCLAVPVLRRKYPDEPDRFRLKGGWLIPALAVALCVGLLARSAPSDLAAAAGALALGFLLSAKMWRRAGAWLGGR
jgi:APA family basic amino acid/polyamine antiporter